MLLDRGKIKAIRTEKITNVGLRQIKSWTRQPYISELSADQEPLQGYSLSIAPEKEISVQLGYMTFASEDKHHHIPLENLKLCTLTNIRCCNVETAANTEHLLFTSFTRA